MSGTPSLSPLLSYDTGPLYIAIGIIIVVATWYGFVFWLTRHREQRVLTTLPPAAPIFIDNTYLKQVYLERIAAVERAYHNHEIRARVVHQQLSLIVREFVMYVERMPVLTMTLTDLKRSRQDRIAPIIESLYVAEFAAVESGSVDAALSASRKVVSEWV